MLSSLTVLVAFGLGTQRARAFLVIALAIAAGVALALAKFSDLGLIWQLSLSDRAVVAAAAIAQAAFLTALGYLVGVGARALYKRLSGGSADPSALRPMAYSFALALVAAAVWQGALHQRLTLSRLQASDTPLTRLQALERDPLAEAPWKQDSHQ